MTEIADLRAPKENGAVLAEPSLETAPELVEMNRWVLSKFQKDILGQDFQVLRHLARKSLIEVAREEFRKAGEPIPKLIHFDSLLLSGHQPELFHPGVWVKNFALAGLSKKIGASAVNLVVDNDIVKSTQIVVPRLELPLPPASDFSLFPFSLPFDLGSLQAPYEERLVHDEKIFARFPENFRQNWGFAPFLNTFWPDVMRQSQRTPLLGERIVGARRHWERRWGCHNLEISVSRVGQTEPFAWFVCHLLTELPRFHHLHNQIVARYRKQHQIRSRNHPVPNLVTEDDWLETPFWAWRSGADVRRRLFARVNPESIDLRAGAQIWPSLSTKGHSPNSLVRTYQQMQAAGYKIRPRALTNTLFARVFVADLFLHGLGGGKYDELTDKLIRDFYGLEPPAYLILSATLHLPFPHYDSSLEDCRQLWRHWRDLRWNPQRHIPAGLRDDPSLNQLIEEKERLIEQHGLTRRQRKRRFFALRKVTESLCRPIRQQEEAIRQQWWKANQETQANQVLQRRDYSFCLHPEETLRPFCTRFLNL